MKAVVLLALAVALLYSCAAGAQPGAANTSAGSIVVLKTDIDTYGPMMSSAFGIHIFAADGNGNPVKGDWTATWGQFCTATQTQGGGWKIGEAKETWEGAVDIWWQFSTKPTPNGEMPSAVSIYFNGGGASQTLLLAKCGNLMLQVVKADASASPQPSPASTSK